MVFLDGRSANLLNFMGCGCILPLIVVWLGRGLPKPGEAKGFNEGLPSMLDVPEDSQEFLFAREFVGEILALNNIVLFLDI
jgi:hypothetical protein